VQDRWDIKRVADRAYGTASLGGVEPDLIADGRRISGDRRQKTPAKASARRPGEGLSEAREAGLEGKGARQGARGDLQYKREKRPRTTPEPGGARDGKRSPTEERRRELMIRKRRSWRSSGGGE